MKTNLTYPAAIVLHIVIGMIIFFNEKLAKVYFLAALFFFLYRIIMSANDKKTFEILKACAFFVGAEVLFRMTRGAFSYEAAKYLVILFMIMGMFYKGLSGNSYPYFLYVMLLVPSIFVASTTLSFDANFRTNIAFVLSGPVCLGISAMYCYNKKVPMAQLSKILYFMVLPIISHTTYLFLYTPSVKEVLTSTVSNRDTSGGFGPNQVATMIGLGIFLVAFRLFTKSPTIGLKIINAVLLILMSFRALVTFSRGGVLTAIFTISTFIFFYYISINRKKRNEVIGLIFIFALCLGASWFISSSETGGLINNRYVNKDHLGREKTDITTGRGELFFEELSGFISNPFFGIGSSRAKDQRIEIEGQGVTSHSEVSRTLAEHGMLGVVILVILLVKPIDFRSRNRQNYLFYSFLCFWFATINHSSMRLAAPAFIYALALINVTHAKSSVHRKQLK